MQYNADNEVGWILRLVAAWAKASIVVHVQEPLWQSILARLYGTPNSPDRLWFETRFRDLPHLPVDRIGRLLCKGETYHEKQVFHLCSDPSCNPGLPGSWRDIPHEYIRHGISSETSFARVWGQIDPEAFKRCFTQWRNQVHEKLRGEVISIAGETVCGSKKQKTSRYA